MAQSNPSAARAISPGALAEQFQRRWLAEREPSLDEFLATATAASAPEICGVLRVDLRERWRSGARVSPTSYLSRFPQVAEDSDAAGDLIFTEFLLREDLGESPTEEEYLARYPRYAQLLSAPIQFHHAVNEVNLSSPSEESLSISSQDSLMEVGQQSSAQPTRMPETIGRYRIVRLLGRGGMGSVWLARDIALDRDVALKLPRLSKARGAKVVERFYREARAAAKLSHPNLCVIHDVGDESGIPYLAMQYLAGESLDTVLRREAPLAPRRALGLAIQIAKGLEAVHRGGVVHRDLKPANVIFNEHDVPIVTDFGLAFLQSATRDDLADAAEYSGNCTPDSPEHETAANQRLTIGGQLLGTPAYAAPEQLLGNIDGFSVACDVYSLGIVLFEMLTGHVPFDGSVAEVTRRVFTLAIPPPSVINADIPRSLDAICLQALEKDPSARFESMSAFRIALEEAAEALEHYALGESESRPFKQLTPTPNPPSASRSVPSRRHFLAAGCVTVLSGGAAYYALRLNRNTSRRQGRPGSTLDLTTASAKFARTLPLELDDNAPPLPIVRQHAWQDRHAFLTGFSPDGAHYWCGGEYYLGEQVRVWDTNTGRQTISVRGSYLRFSPDSQTAYSAVRNQTPKIERWNLESESRLPALELDELAIDIAASPDGKTLISTYKECLLVWNIESREVVWECPLQGFVAPRLSTEIGNRVFVYDAGNSGEAVLLDLSQRRILRHFSDSDPSPSRLLRWAPETSSLTIINGNGIASWKGDSLSPMQNLHYTADGNKITANAISGDSRWAILATELSPHVYLVNLMTGKTHGVASVGATEILIGYHAISPDGRFAVFCRPAPSEVFVLAMPPEVWQTTAQS